MGEDEIEVTGEQQDGEPTESTGENGSGPTGKKGKKPKAAVWAAGAATAEQIKDLRVFAADEQRSVRAILDEAFKPAWEKLLEWIEQTKADRDSRRAAAKLAGKLPEKAEDAEAEIAKLEARVAALRSRFGVTPAQAADTLAESSRLAALADQAVIEQVAAGEPAQQAQAIWAPDWTTEQPVNTEWTPDGPGEDPRLDEQEEAEEDQPVAVATPIGMVFTGSSGIKTAAQEAAERRAATAARDEKRQRRGRVAAGAE